VNGSHARLPFELDPQRVPVVGSFQEGSQFSASTTTKWYSLPENREDHPLITLSAAGTIGHYDSDNVFQYGQLVKVEYGKSTGKGQDDFEPLGEDLPLDIGTAPQWRNLRIPMEWIPEEADQIRIVGVDPTLPPPEWLALPPPRAPQREPLKDYVVPRLRRCWTGPRLSSSRASGHSTTTWAWLRCRSSASRRITPPAASSPR